MTVIPVEELASVDDPETVVAQIINPATDGRRYPYFHRLRELAPVHRTEHPALKGFYLVSTYDYASQVLSQSGVHFNTMDYMHVGNKGPYYWSARNWMNFQATPEEHDRIRAHFSGHFTPQAVARYKPMIAKLVDELLDRQTARGGMELVSDFAFPLPAMVIARVLGLEDSDVLRLQQIVDRYVESCDQGHALGDDSERFRDQMTIDLQNLFRDYLAERRKQPRQDLISAVAQAQQQSGKITDDEILDNCIFALLAGHTTTTDMLGNITVALDRFPAQREKLRAKPERIGAAITEFMRYDASIATAARYGHVPITLGEQTIPAGANYFVMMHGAHHDPARFENPDDLDVERVFPRQPFPFGMGKYFCLGAVLAKLEMELAVTAMLARFPRLAVTSVQWPGTLLTHGPKRLEVSW